MKKNTLIFILGGFILNFLSCAQTQAPHVADLKIKKKVLKKYRKQDVDQCELGLQKAMNDYYNGVFQIYYWGDSACSEDSTCVRFKRLLKREYGIAWDPLGCTPFERDQCYSEWVERKLKGVHGNDFFDKIWKRAAQSTQKH